MAMQDLMSTARSREHSPNSRSIARARYPVLLALLLVCLAVQWAVPLATLPHRVSWNYGEGWNAYWAARAVAGLSLYTDRSSALTNNYPPLSFFLAGIAGRLIGDQILAGRLISLTALLGCAVMTGWMVARMGADRRWATAAALAFLLYIGDFAWRYIATDDPQWLAAVPSLAALLLLGRPDRTWPGRWRVVVAAALLVTGGLIKHNEVAAPFAVTLWLLPAPRPVLVAWLAAGALFATAALLATGGLFGPLAFDQIVHHARVMKPRYLLNALETLSGLLPEATLGWMLWRGRRTGPAQPALDLLLLFAAVAVVVGMVERLGTGVSVNAHFDAAIGCFLLGGIALGRPALSARARWWMSVAVLAPLVAATAAMLPATLGRLTRLGEADRQWQAAIARIHAAPGPVACEMAALCYWANRPFVLDFFNYGQKMRERGDPAHLADAVRHRRFAAMVVVRDRRYRRGDGRLPVDVNQAIERNYRTVAALPDHAVLITPRPVPAS